MNDQTAASIKTLFDAGALDYDRDRRKVIFCFDDFYATLIGRIPFSEDQRFRFMDLGAGTGLVSALIAERFPRAEGTLVDLSEKMLEKARRRFHSRTGIRCRVADYHRSPLTGSYDLIVSAMSIHHLSDPDKQTLFGKVFDTLCPGGTFVHADLVKGTTAATEAAYQAHWQAHLAQIGLPSETLAQITRRMSYDRPATLHDQLQWMTAAGFLDVDCYFKHYNFAVYAGRKSGNGH